MFGDLARVHLALTQELENAPPGRIGQCFENRTHLVFRKIPKYGFWQAISRKQSIALTTCPKMARLRHAGRAGQCQLSGVHRTWPKRPAMSLFDAVDGAHSAASECHRVVASKQTTLRGAVHGRSYHNWS